MNTNMTITQDQLPDAIRQKLQAFMARRSEDHTLVRLYITDYPNMRDELRQENRRNEDKAFYYRAAFETPVGIRRCYWYDRRNEWRWAKDDGPNSFKHNPTPCVGSVEAMRRISLSDRNLDDLAILY